MNVYDSDMMCTVHFPLVRRYETTLSVARAYMVFVRERYIVMKMLESRKFIVTTPSRWVWIMLPNSGDDYKGGIVSIDDCSAEFDTLEQAKMYGILNLN